MPSPKQDKVAVACPGCGHIQLEPREAYSSRCKKCHAHFRVQEALNPVAPAAKSAIATRSVQCFQCGAALDAPVAASSTMCKRCSSHVDLSDYKITQTVSKNFRTHGRLVVEEKGYLLNTDAHVGEALLKGRLIGKIHTARTLEIHNSARLQGTIYAGQLLLPEHHVFAWADTVRVGGAEIAGELVANLKADGAVLLRASGRLFGDVESKGLIIEPGAVFVGHAKVTA